MSVIMWMDFDEKKQHFCGQGEFWRFFSPLVVVANKNTSKGKRTMDNGCFLKPLTQSCIAFIPWLPGLLNNKNDNDNNKKHPVTFEF